MKQIALLIALLIPFIPVTYAAENAVLDPASISTSAASSDSFGVTVTRESKLITKAGSLFTEGDEPGMTMPYLLSNPKPIIYPRWAVRNGWEGECIIAIEILPNGSVDRYYIMKSTGRELLDKEVVKAVRTWKFHPATRDEKPTVTCIQIPITFQLQDE